MTALGAQGYVVLAAPCVCHCDSPKKQLFMAKKLDSAIAVADGHWNVYLTFFGELAHWLDIIVVDSRDGVIEWRNGRRMRKEHHGESASQG